MADVDRHVTSDQLMRLLGDWRSSSGPLYALLARRLGQLLADGQLAPALRLPSERGLADALALSRNTVIRAYAVLREQGLLESRRGAGSVTRLGPGSVAQLIPWAVANRLPTGRPVIDLTKAIPPTDERLFDALQEAAGRAGPLLAHHGYYPLGLPALRSAIAERYEQRGLPTRPEQILVTNGAQQAIDLFARSNVRYRDTVVLESPTYAGAMDSLRTAGARLVSLDVSATPWDLGHLDEVFSQTGARVAYLMPDFQNPTGAHMADEQRAELVAICRRRSVTLVVDETLAETPIDPTDPARPVAGYDATDSVVSIGSMSKAVWAGLRVGWIRTSPRQVAALAAIRSVADLGGAPLEQLAAADLLPQLPEIARDRAAALRRQRTEVTAFAHEHGWSISSVPRGGLSVWASLPYGSSTLLADLAHRHGVLIVAGPRLSPDGALDRYVRLPYGLPLDLLAPALGGLDLAWADVPSSSGNDDPPGLAQVI